MKTLAIVQARMNSTRLPGKIFADIGGEPMLRRLLDRLAVVSSIDDIVVATTINSEDDQLVDWLANFGVNYYRGSSEDVLDRFAQAASGRNADFILRVTADDPLKDPGIISKAIKILESNASLDYVSNTIQPTWPEGLDIEVFRYSTLMRAHKEATLHSDREHVTTYIWNHPNLFNLHNFCWERNLSRWRWTVDKPCDLEFIRKIFCEFADNPLVDYLQIVDWLESNPELLLMNCGTIRNEGYLMSIKSETQP